MPDPRSAERRNRAHRERCRRSARSNGIAEAMRLWKRGPWHVQRDRAGRPRGQRRAGSRCRSRDSLPPMSLRRCSPPDSSTRALPPIAATGRVSRISSPSLPRHCPRRPPSSRRGFAIVAAESLAGWYAASVNLLLPLEDASSSRPAPSWRSTPPVCWRRCQSRSFHRRVVRRREHRPAFALSVRAFAMNVPALALLAADFIRAADDRPGDERRRADPGAAVAGRSVLRRVEGHLRRAAMRALPPQVAERGSCRRAPREVAQRRVGLRVDPSTAATRAAAVRGGPFDDTAPLLPAPCTKASTVPSLRLRTQPATLLTNADLHGRVAIAHALHATADDQAKGDDAHRLRSHANSAAMVLPSVTSPRRTRASNSSSVIVTTSRNSPTSRRAPTWVRPVASNSVDEFRRVADLRMDRAERRNEVAV